MYDKVYAVLKKAPDIKMNDWCADFDSFPEEDKQYFAECLAYWEKQPEWKYKSDKEKSDMLILEMNRRSEELLWTPVG
jgi:thiamine pyrophosphokinase